MFILRLLAVLTLIAVAGGILAYLLTGNPRYLALAVRLFRWALVVALLVFALLAVERLAIIPL